MNYLNYAASQAGKLITDVTEMGPIGGAAGFVLNNINEFDKMLSTKVNVKSPMSTVSSGQIPVDISVAIGHKPYTGPNQKFQDAWKTTTGKNFPELPVSTGAKVNPVGFVSDVIYTGISGGSTDSITYNSPFNKKVLSFVEEMYVRGKRRRRKRKKVGANLI